MRRNTQRKVILFAAATSALVGTSWSNASVVVWDGNGADNNWSTSLNWLGGVAPISGDSLVFDQARKLTPANNGSAGTLFSGLTFTTSAGAFSLSGNSITLGGDIVDASVNAESSSIPMVLTATRTVNVASRSGSLTLSGIISGTSFGITKTGDGVLSLSGVNTFTGPIEIDGGVISVAVDSTATSNPLGSGAAGARLTLNGGTLRTSASLQISTNRLTTLGASGGTFDVATGTTLYSGVISGATSFTKTGLGILELGGQNTYTGDTDVNQGTLQLDFGNGLVGTTSVLNAASRVVLGGPATAVNALTSTAGVTFNVNGRGTTTTRSQTINGLVLGGATPATAGVYATVSTTNVGNGVLLNLGAITHNAGGLVNFSRNGTLSAGNSIVTSNSNSSGILGGWALYGSDYATNDGSGNIVALTTYDQNLTVTGSTIADASTNNVKLSQSGTATYSLSGSPTALVSVNTINQAGAGTAVVSLAAGDTLRLGTQGGVLIGSAGASLTIGQTAGQGKITAGGADGTGGEISFINLSASASLTVNAGIFDNGGGAVSVTYYAAAGGIQLAGANGAFAGTSTYTGGTVIAGGRVLTGSNNVNAFGTGSVTVLQGGQVVLTGTTLGGAKTWTNNFYIAGLGAGTVQTGALSIGARPDTVISGVSGMVTLIGDARIGVVDTSTDAHGFISGQITGNYALEFGSETATNLGIVQLSNQGTGSNANNWTGNTTISQIVQLAGAVTATDLLPDGAGKGNIIFFGTGVATLDLNGKSETINAINGAGTNGIITNTDVGTASVFTLGNGDATGTYSGKVVDHVTTGGTVAIVKTGAGAQTFSSANNTYSGSTTVQNGKLIVASGSSLGTGDVFVTGSGSVLELDAATDSAAIADSANLYLSGNGLVELDYSGTETINALQLNGTFLATGIYNAASMATAGYITGAGSLTVTATPEPASLGVLGLGACGVLARRRRTKAI